MSTYPSTPSGWTVVDRRTAGSFTTAITYRHPDGRESYCYNTKFADVVWNVNGERHTSRCGELEVLLV